MQVIPVGQLAIGHIRSAYGYQSQPQVSVPDYALNWSTGQVTSLDGIRVDANCLAAFAQPLLVPHHQVFAAYGVHPPLADQDAYLETVSATSMPEQQMAVATSSGPIQWQQYQNQSWGNQEVYAAWNGCPSQTETATVVAASRITGSGNATVVVTASGLAGSPKTYSAAVTLGDYAYTVAGKIRTALAADTALKALYGVGGGDANVSLSAVNPATTDSSLNISIANGSCAGLTAAPTSANTSVGGGVGAVAVEWYTYDDGSHPIKMQGFLAAVTRRVAPAVDSSTETWYRVWWAIGAAYYGLLVGGGGAYAKLQRSDDSGATWSDVASYLKMGGSVLDAVQSSENPVPIEVLLINGTLTVGLGSQTQPLSIAVPGLSALDEPVITQVRVTAGAFTVFGCQIHPLQFVAAGSMISAPVSLGFSPATAPYYTIYGSTGAFNHASGDAQTLTFPSQAALTVTQAGSTDDVDQVYRLDLANPSATVNTSTDPEHPHFVAKTYQGRQYASLTAVCTRVSVNVDGIWIREPAMPAGVIPKSLTEHISFDANALTVSHTLDFVVDNWYGQAMPLAWTGNKAVALTLGYAQPATVQFPRFMGMALNYGFSRPSGNRSVLHVHCVDQMVLFEEPIAAPPDMDGWNHYYAMAFLGQKAGFTLDQMAFAALVPSDPFSAAAGDPEPYYLPMGSGMNPWTPRNRNLPLRELADYIRKPTGFLLYIDSQGYLRYEQWLPNFPGVPKQVFTESATGLDGENLSEFLPDFNLDVDLTEVRNRVLLIGVDAYGEQGWSPLVCKREDMPSIYADPGSEPFNYVGYPRTFLWEDYRFATPAYASTSADRLIAMLRWPGIRPRWRSWLQPQLYPMDWVALQESRTGGGLLPFYITDQVNTWGVNPDGTQTIESQFAGRFVAFA